MKTGLGVEDCRCKRKDTDKLRSCGSLEDTSTPPSPHCLPILAKAWEHLRRYGSEDDGLEDVEKFF